MEFVLGVDAGGTFFRVRACSLDGIVLGEDKKDSLGYFTENKERFLSGFKKNISNCISIFNGDFSDCLFMVAGVSGIDNEEDRFALEKSLEAIIGCEVSCKNDAELANELINGRVGILLNSGTGSIVYGTNEQGMKQRIGGWPLRAFGDEGSGAWVALKAIRFLARWFDGLVPESPLIQKLLKQLSIKDSKDFMDFCLSYTSSQLAKIGPLVDEAAEEGDKEAISILTQAAFESYTLVTELAKKLGYKRMDIFRVGLWGSNILKSNIHLQSFSRLLKDSYPRAIIHYSQEQLICFIARKAVKFAGGEIDRD
ncbi:MAG: BadF/BadG/BcrA/BcrD ATPase family protein [Sphaerochaetaceae bacterium]